MNLLLLGIFTILLINFYIMVWIGYINKIIEKLEKQNEE